MREKITSFVFVFVLLVCFSLILLPKDDAASAIENRPLAEMPTLTAEKVFSGDFSSEYETYVTDNIAFRSRFVKIGTALEKLRGYQKKDTGRIINFPTGTALVLNDGKIMEVYKDKPDATQKYIEVLNKYAEKFSGKTNLYLMLVPTQIEFDQSPYKDLSDSEKEMIDFVYSSLSDIQPVNVYDKLKRHTGEYIYFRTDHHWTQRGGHYGYQSFAEAKGFSPVPLDAMTAKKHSGFLGYLFNQANVDEYKKYADEIEYFEYGENYTVTVKGYENGNPYTYPCKMYNPPAADGTVNYGLFMGGDHQFAEINTNNKNGSVALIIKDSYANTVIPFLANHYEKILVVDPRSFYSTVAALTEEYEIDDILFINYALSTTTWDVIDGIEKIMQ